MVGGTETPNIAALPASARLVPTPMGTLSYRSNLRWRDRSRALIHNSLESAIGSFGGVVCSAFVGWMTVKTGSPYGAIAAVKVLHAIGMIVLLIWAQLRHPRWGSE